MFNMHSPYEDDDLDLDPISLSEDGDEPPETLPVPGSAKLTIEDKCEALFISAEWTLVATVNGTKGRIELARSTSIKKSHTDPFIKRWTRQVIRANKARLWRLGVDVSAVYLQWGGLLEDLEDS